MANHAQNPSVQDGLSRLKKTITNMDGLSQEGFSLISSIASLAMCRLEHGLEHAWQFEELYNALRAICCQAHETENCINGAAESVGCHHENETSVIRQNYFVGTKP